MRGSRTQPSGQRTYIRLYARVDRLEDTISHFYNVINELRRRVSTLEKQLKPLAKDDRTNLNHAGVQESAGLFKRQQLTGLFCERAGACRLSTSATPSRRFATASRCGRRDARSPSCSQLSWCRRASA